MLDGIANDLKDLHLLYGMGQCLFYWGNFSQIST